MPFDAQERAFLLAAPRLGPLVVARLEEAGIDSLDALRAMGAARAVAAVCETVGNKAWANRIRPLESALRQVEVVVARPDAPG